LVAVYKNPNLDHHTRQDAAKAALPYEKPRLQAVTLANEGGEPVKVRSELEIGRRLAFVLELIARGEVKAKLMPIDPEEAAAARRVFTASNSISQKQGSDPNVER
jgi:hypothetical protein